MAKTFVGIRVRKLALVDVAVVAFCIFLIFLVLLMATDHNKDDMFCREIRNPSPAQKLWIFDCAPDFLYSLEFFTLYTLVSIMWIGGPILIVFAIILLVRLLKVKLQKDTLSS